MEMMDGVVEGWADEVRGFSVANVEENGWRWGELCASFWIEQCFNMQILYPVVERGAHILSVMASLYACFKQTAPVWVIF